MRWMHCRFKSIKTMTAIFVIGIVGIITVKREIKSVTALGREKVNCRPGIAMLEGWWNGIVTMEALYLYTDLETGYHKIKITANVSDKTFINERILQENGISVLNNLPKIDMYLFINQSKRGLEKVMNEKNFNGVHCPMKNASFSDNIDQSTSLASFPGSGNTWTRHLIEYISGIHTGSIFNDSLLLPEFRGEGHLLRVIAIKTHRLGFKHYDNAVLLIRHPRDTILSWYNWKTTKSHTDKPEASMFNISGWSRHVSSATDKWKSFYLAWMNDFKGGKMLLSYSRLQHDFFNELRRLADFLNIAVPYKSLWCVYEGKEGNYRRQSHIDRNKVFTNDMLDKIDRAMNEVQTAAIRVFGDDARGMF